MSVLERTRQVPDSSAAVGAAAGAVSSSSAGLSSTSSPVSASSRKPVILVFFIGGVSFPEVTAIRQLGLKTQRDFIVCTTKLINGNTLVSSMVERIENNLDKSSIAH